MYRLRFIMLHFLNVVKERLDQREEIAEGRFLPEALLMPLHGIPFDDQNPVLRFLLSAQQAVARQCLEPCRIGSAL